MATDSNSGIDPKELAKNIEAAEVFCLYFPLLRKTLVIDTRSDADEGALVKVLPMAKSAEDRFRSLRRMRPRFLAPDKITMLQWRSYVDSLVRLGIWDRLLERFARNGDAKAVAACREALAELRLHEKAELTAAVIGKHYHTIWQATPR